MTKRLVDEFLPDCGSIQDRYLQCLPAKKSTYHRNDYCVVFVSDAGYQMQRSSPVRVQSLDIITKVGHRRQGHGTSVMKQVVESLVRLSLCTVH